MSFCSKCGTKNSEISKFCSNCGFKLNIKLHEDMDLWNDINAINGLSPESKENAYNIILQMKNENNEKNSHKSKTPNVDRAIATWDSIFKDEYKNK